MRGALRLVPLFVVGCGLFGPTEYARRLAEHMASEKQVPCEAFASGSTVTLGDFDVRFERPQVLDPEVTTLKSASEREAFGRPGTKAYAVPFERRNNAPVQQPDRLRYELRLSDGSSVDPAPGNTRLYDDREGREQPADRGDSPTDQWVKSAYVYALDPAAANGAVMYVVLTEVEKRGEYGRRVETVAAHAIVDLAKPTEGASLVQP